MPPIRPDTVIKQKTVNRQAPQSEDISKIIFKKQSKSKQHLERVKDWGNVLVTTALINFYFMVLFY